MQTNSGARSAPVPRRELARERVERPHPAAGDEQPQLLAGAKLGCRGWQGDVDGNYLTALQGMRVGEGVDGLAGRGQLRIERAHGRPLQAGLDPVAAEAVGAPNATSRPLRHFFTPTTRWTSSASSASNHMRIAMGPVSSVSSSTTWVKANASVPVVKTALPGVAGGSAMSRPPSARCRGCQSVRASGHSCSSGTAVTVS